MLCPRVYRLQAAVAAALATFGCSQPPAAEAPQAEPSANSTEGAGTETATDSTTPSPDAESALLEPSTSTSSSDAPPSGPKDARGKEEIQRVVAANRDKVRACYDAALKENPGIAGDLVVSFVIDPAGQVKTAEVNWAESELHIPELDTCAVDVVKTLQFPPSSRGLESKVNYPFNFNPAPPDSQNKAPPPVPSTPR